MIQNYFKIAWRNLLRNKVHSLVNIVGLAMGITAFLLILEYVSFERSYNTFHQNISSLYRVVKQTPKGDVWVDMEPAVAPLAKQEFPEVQEYCRVAEHSANGIVTITDPKENKPLQSFRESELAYADASFFTLFTFPLVQGTATSALTQPNTVALSESQSRKYFDTVKSVGKVLTLNNQFGKTIYTVTAVYADMPPNSDLQFEAIFALQTLANPANLNGNDWARLDSFDGSYVITFLQLPEESPGVPADFAAMADKFNALKKSLNPEDQSLFVLQPAKNLHLAESLNEVYRTSGSLSFVYLLSCIAVLILLIAWFNYVNLSTAGALKRAKEVGVRKVVGAGSKQLAGQFLGESLVLNLLGFALALGMVASLQEAFNGFVQKELSLTTLGASVLSLGLLLLVVGALVSGGYVAFTLISFQPVETLKGVLPTGRGGFLRKSLVVAQFSASIALVAGTLVLYQQLRYMQNENLGMELDQRMVIKSPEVGEGSFADRTAALENDLAQLPYVKNFCQTGIVPGGYYNFSANRITRQNASPEDARKTYSMGIVDDRYLATYGIALAAGRNFTPREAELGWEKSAKLMINEKAARQFGFASPEAAAGQIINWGQPYEIVGVVKDYHHQGLKQVIDPIVFMPRRSVGYLTVNLSTDNIQRKIGELEALYKKSYPGNPFEFFFVDEQYNRQYESEQQYGKVFTAASLLAIFIACLGLFGLTTYTTEQRTKEIGVRKVLGASVTSIVALLSKDFLKLVLIAIVIASPLAWYAMNEWLADFAYKIDIEWWVFALAGGLAVGIALLTVSFQSVKAALMNPVESLRSE
ncbi:ABC transporter permease [Persicitalea sp.]|uniref:ABC transporter permease n=1 Tax=Persicitalea sp. TaxID=3100273 RepID=UPI0035949365